jgi:hypothetical protein
MAVDYESVKGKLSEGRQRLIGIASIVVAITGLAGGWTWYLNHFYKPTVVVNSVDFKNGSAKITSGGKEISIYGNATFQLTNFGDWGVRFGTSQIDGELVYNRLELTKNNLVVEYLEAPGSALK